MNERLQELLDAVQRTASQVGGSAADAAYGMGKRAGELLSVAKLNIRIMDLQIDRLEREIARLQGGAVCPFCGAAARSGDVFCRECGQKL